ncbi:dynein axonemal heavy chain 12-like [Culicoides brevitarsis]|uniref:dynein axonemal heavy chain 12-like n=1 Tax=Culicoides brevitarsis TaxID=469753 RepID=UPI00307B4FC6
MQFLRKSAFLPSMHDKFYCVWVSLLLVSHNFHSFIASLKFFFLNENMKKVRRPKIDENFNHDPYATNPLLKFNLRNVKKRERCEILRDFGKKAKIQEFTKPREKSPPSDRKSQKFYKNELLKYVKQAPIPKMPRRIETRIIHSASANLRQKYPEIVKSYMSSVHQEFDAIMKNYSIHKIIRRDDVTSDDATKFRVARRGKTATFDVFLKNREKIKRNLMIFHPFVRFILVSSIKELPLLFINLQKLDFSQGTTTLPLLKTKILQEIQSSTVKIQKNWFPKVCQVITKHYKKRTIASKQWEKALNCAGGLINRQLNEIKQQTIENLIKDIAKFFPCLEIIGKCGTEITFSPSMNEIRDVFLEILDEILSMGRYLSPLSYIFDENAQKIIGKPRWKIEIGEIYPVEARKMLIEALDQRFSEVNSYICAIQDDFRDLYSSEALEKINFFLSVPRQFEECQNKITELQFLLTKVHEILEKEFFHGVAIIFQAEIHEKLSLTAKNLMTPLTSKLFESHKQENLAICEEFETIKRKALEHPKSTEDLVANGAYVLHIRNTYIVELEERVRKSIAMMTTLVELRELSSSELSLQIRVIAWLQKLRGVMEENASNYEHFKSLFEEKLVHVKNCLCNDIEEFLPLLSVLNDMNDDETLRENMTLLNSMLDKIQLMCDSRTWINKEEALFKFPLSKYPKLDDIEDFVGNFASLIRRCIQWFRKYWLWMDGPFEYLDPTFVSNTTEDFQREFSKILKYYKSQIKADMLRGSVCKWRGSLDDNDALNHPTPVLVCQRMLQHIKDFRIGVYMIGIMCNPALRERHWEEMSSIAGYDITPDAGTTIRKMQLAGVLDLLDQFEIVSVSANKELQLQQNLETMIEEWKNIKFVLSPYKETELMILTQLDDIQCILEDHIVKTLSMRGSAFVKPCEQKVKDWYAKLVRVNQTIDQWGRVQSKWLYLLPIFSSKDIVSQMPEEGRLFQQVNNTYKRYMSIVAREPIVMEVAPSAGLLEAMEQANAMLEDIENGVNNYLEKKRLYFPRFFFLSNDEMLDILSETKDPLKVQPHLSKCFEGINRLKFDENLDIHSMFSVEREEVQFLQKISTTAAKGSVEKWLLEVQTAMLKAVNDQILKSFEAYMTENRTSWVLNWPGMIVLCVSQIFWAAEMHDCFKKRQISAVNDYFEKLKANLNDIVTLIRSESITNLQRITIKALIVIDVHAKDVVEELISKKVVSETDFNWLVQLRYYLEETFVAVKVITASVKFANEYLGNSDRLVITPLTDRCYRTLMGAYQLHLNGAPEGPAGTGKTETTKDLAKALAVQCIVFNCSDSLDYKAMGKFFKGLASCGAWVCFDEFNRIDLEVLSVVAQQILQIVVAVRGNMKTFVFEGTTLELNPACYVCITMNPGYAGRSELPDNLKVLFRTVAMMVPDYALIGEISLYSFGFVNARVLAVKIVSTYRLCSEQLSSQNHYDYGMRAVKTVLQACGNLKKQFPNDDEEILLLRSLIDVNLPKFLSFDVPLFNGIISDLFPGVELPKPDYQIFIETFEEVCKEMKLQPHSSFLVKVIQTFEMMIVRHGFMMVGDPYAGKSSTLKVLAEVLKRLKPTGANPYYQEVEMSILNPKSISINTLYGAFDPVSYEWTDGVASTFFRNFSNDPSANRKWLIFDGPVDPNYIENMNTVLDDNKKLCLTSGEVITMSPEMSIIFEVMDLAQASPATVSRCGMIYMEPVTLGWETFVKSWIESFEESWIENLKDYLMEVIKWAIPESIDFVRKHCTQFLYPGETKLLMQTLTLIQMQLIDAYEQSTPEEAEKYLTTWIQAAIAFAQTWGVAGLLDANSRLKFDDFLKNMWKIEETKNFKIEILLPTEGLLFDYFYQYKQKGLWRSWQETLKAQKGQNSGQIVPTIETLRYMNILDMYIKHNKTMLLIGPTGTGKSLYIQSRLMSLDSGKFLPSFITFTTQTTAEQTQEIILSKLHKHRRGIYGAPPKKACLLFIDDINMPTKELYGAQPPIELLRQYFDHGNWFDASDASVIRVRDILIFAACGVVGGSRQDVYARFLCHFNLFAINDFSDETMQRIFTATLLDGYRKTGHGNDVVTSCTSIVNATLETYKFACSNLRPTPAKSHYLFNLRDIARVIMGCALLRKESVGNRRIFARLWLHEVMRVFYDRLVDVGDRERTFAKLLDCLKDIFREKPEDLLPEFTSKDSKTALDETKIASNLCFGSYFFMDSDADERKYEETLDLQQFQDLAYKSLQEYNAVTRNKMNIVLFQYALMHLNRICRILTMPESSCLLVGVAGSGRQSLTRLAANILQQTFFQPEITKNYSLQDWRDDLKIVLKESGGMGRDTVFVMNEGQIKSPTFLQDIDCLLNLGEVPNIYAIDEKQEILEMVRLAAQGGNRNVDISPLQVFQFFINRTKQKLHFILCFSPIGSSFRTRIRMFPSLVNCCTINWFESWPDDALEMVAEQYIETLNVDSEVKKGVVKACQVFHTQAISIKDEFYRNTGRIMYITSASYLELIKSFTKVMDLKQKEVMDNKMRYIIGLQKLDLAAQAVSIMQTNLNDLQPKLIIMAGESTKMAEQIEKETIDASKATEQVKKDEVVVNIKAGQAQELKTECEKDLEIALPILKEAERALNTLKPADINEVKNFKTPPRMVQFVMTAVVILKGGSPVKQKDPKTGKLELDYWPAAKKLLGEMNFLQSLMEFDKDNIPLEIINKIRSDFIANKDFDPKIIRKSSRACEGLCNWIIAIDKYDRIAREVAPKKAKLASAEQEFQETMNLLQEKRNMANALEERVKILNEALADALEKKQQMENEVDLCKKKLIRAESLIKGLGGEKSRWIAAAEQLQAVYDDLAGDVLISCGIIAYLAPVTTIYRNTAATNWLEFCKNMKIPCSKEYSLIKVLGADITIQDWNLCGLPRDVFSIENGIVMQNSQKFSLFIDPQGQANKWIKQMEKQNQLNVLKFSQKDYMKTLEKCIEHGYSVLIENVLEDVDVALNSLLSRNTFIIAGQESISLGDNVIAYSPNFRLYFTSSLRNPHYVPEIFNKVTIINFSLTPEGLNDQLLGIVVAKERPELQELREKLVFESASNKAQLKNVEDGILNILSESKGDILEDEEAIQMLDNSKLIAIDIKQKQEETAKTENEIEKFRQSYSSVAKHCTNLYYCITDLPNIDPMYQFSLNWFVNLYIYSIENAKKSRELEKRLVYLKKAATSNLYQNICRSLFEKDKLLFSFILATKVMIAEGRLNSSELQFLIMGGDLEVPEKLNPASEWISDKMWTQICSLNQLGTSFKGFIESFVTNINEWKSYFDVPSPHLQELPSPWNTKLTEFQKLLILQAIRPDKLAEAVTIFVAKDFGEEFVAPPPFDIARSYRDSSALSPLVFILSPGADPMGSLLLFAEKMGFMETFKFVSLGQGQGPIAQKLLENAQRDGTWVCLQNCHLACSWMPQLEVIWENMDVSNTNPNYRLWLTSYPSECFPVPILQNSIKMTNEPPTGLKQNLLKSYNSEPMNDVDFYSGCPPLKETAFTRLLFGICFFHAVVQERKKFGALGWNIPYGFNESDFQISVQQLQLFLNTYEEIPYQAISYLTGECNYGGRVTDFWDRRLISTILDDYVNSEVVENVNYRFCESLEFGMPQRTEHRKVVEFIEENVPLMPNPDVYGLHPNAGIQRDLNTSNLLIDSMFLVQGKASGGSDTDTDKALMTFAIEIEAKLPKPFDLEEVIKKYPIDYNESMNTVLVQEMERFNKLLVEIKTTCVEIQKAIKGLAVMTPELEATCSSILFKKIPEKWMKKSYPSLKMVASYITDFLERLNFLQTWSEMGKPSSFWLSGFFFTQAFLTGAMQNYARKYQIPIDTLTFDFEVLKTMNTKIPPEDGVYIYGLFIDGARWLLQEGYLDEQLPKILVETMPLMHFIPTLISNLKETGRYKCPVYKTMERRGTLSTTGHSTNYVLTTLIKTRDPVSHWIKRSVALVCQTSD